LIGKPGCPGTLQRGDTGLCNLAEGGEDKLAADEGIITVDEMAVGGYIAIACDKEAGAAAVICSGCFDIVESSLEEAAGRLFISRRTMSSFCPGMTPPPWSQLLNRIE